VSAAEPSPDELEDDATIPDDAIVWRRLSWKQTADSNDVPGTRRLSSGGFDDSSDGSGMSVHLVQPNETIDAFLASVSRPDDGIAVLTVGDIRAIKCGIVRRPEKKDPHHCEITGRVRTKRKREDLYNIAKKRGLARTPMKPTE